jgi:hypothetical protein
MGPEVRGIVLDEMKRVLRPDGQMLVTAWHAGSGLRDHSLLLCPEPAGPDTILGFPGAVFSAIAALGGAGGLQPGTGAKVMGGGLPGPWEDGLKLLLGYVSLEPQHFNPFA